MTTPRDLDEVLAAWLDEGPTRLPDQTRRAISVAIPTVSRRRRAMRVPWRPPTMFNPTRIGVVAVVGALFIGGAYLYSTNSNKPAIGGPNPTSASSSAIGSPGPSAPPTSSASPGSSGALADPSGTIVFLRHDPGTELDTAYAMAADGTGLRSISDTTSCCLTLLDDGLEVLMSSEVSGLMTPMIVPLRSDGDTEGPEDTQGLNLAPWAASRDAFALEGWKDGTPARTGIWLSIDNGGGLIWGDLRQITTHQGSGHDVPIAFSPDGTKLLFLRENDPGGDLYVVGIDGAGLRKVNPDGTHIMHDAFLGAGASWSPDGSRIAFAGFDPTDSSHDASVFVVDADGSLPPSLVAGGHWTTSVAWSPDGRRIVFDRDNLAGSHDLILVDPVDGTKTNLTSDFAPGVCCGTWSPDGRYILVQGTPSDDQHNDLYAIAADGSGVTQLTNEPGVYTSYAWSPETQLP